jgi:hypothetical protein
MSCRMLTPIRVIDKHIKASADVKLRVMANALCYVGEQCIAEARNGGTYTDRTGNLRSSIGYAVLINGKVLKYEQVEKTLNGNEGLTQGQKYLQERVKKAKSKGVMLIVTAGMNYAEYVETKRVVLASVQLKAPDMVRRIMTSIGFICK